MLLPGIIKSGLGEYYRSFSIGYWAWELEALPAEWVNALKFVQAVIVPSRFCQAAVQRYTAKPVLVVPHPVDASLFAPQRPEASDVFRVVNIFRFGSSFERKNPIAAVRAFRAAFGDDRTAELVLKTSYGDRYAADKARLLAEIGSAANIRLIDAVWSEAEMAALVQSASVYLSLHRSEGFGLPIAEAIMAETPVLATAWSGNEDFCSRHDTYLCDYTLVPFRDTHPDYEQVANARWAEPSVAHAAEQLRHMRDNPDPARARRAKRALQQHLATWDYERALQTILNGTRRPARAANEQADASALSRRVQMGERNARP
jgi:glycosyltransferase involved in cell wall biosynthesis